MEPSSGGVASDVIDGYVWSIIPTQAVGGITAAGDDFAPLAARRLILATMRRERGKLDQLATLDRLHDIAIKNSIVTPYSSMLVLVNARQQELLDELQSQGDRFQRESEDVGQTQPPSQPSVTGVPEPEEWLLLALAVAMIGWYVRTKPSPARAVARNRS